MRLVTASIPRGDTSSGHVTSLAHVSDGSVLPREDLGSVPVLAGDGLESGKLLRSLIL